MKIRHNKPSIIILAFLYFINSNFVHRQNTFFTRFLHVFYMKFLYAGNMFYDLHRKAW